MQLAGLRTGSCQCQIPALGVSLDLACPLPLRGPNNSSPRLLLLGLVLGTHSLHPHRLPLAMAHHPMQPSPLLIPNNTLSGQVARAFLLPISRPTTFTRQVLASARLRPNPNHSQRPILLDHLQHSRRLPTPTAQLDNRRRHGRRSKIGLPVRRAGRTPTQIQALSYAVGTRQRRAKNGLLWEKQEAEGGVNGQRPRLRDPERRHSRLERTGADVVLLRLRLPCVHCALSKLREVPAL
jgi:hypothetical protein